MSELQQAVGLAILAQACDLAHFFPVEGRKLELPTYVWQHEHYWYQPSTESYQILDRFPVHPLLGAAVPREPLCWESHLSTGSHEWLSGHDVGGSIVLPGAAFTEIALNAASHFQEVGIIELEDLEILSPLILDDELGKVVQTRVSQSGKIEISSRGYSLEENWRPHVKAKIVHQPTGLALQDVTIPEIPQTPEDFDHHSHYALTDKAGLNYQGAFKSVTRGWEFEDAIFAELNLAENQSHNLHQFYLHPGLLDSAIQLVVHQLSEQINAVSGVAFVPISLEKISCVNQKDNPPAYVFLKCLHHSPHSLLTRMELFDEKMNPLAIIENLRYRAVKLVDKKQHLSYLDYHLIPAPRVNKGIPVLAEKIHSVLSKSFYAYAENQKLYQNEFLPLIDSLVHLAITEQFIQLKENDPQRLDELASEYIEKSETLDSRRYHVFDYAVNQGLISLDDQQLIVEEEHSHGGEISSELIWNTLIREYPDYFEETHLVGSFMLEIGSLFSTNDSFTKQVEYSEVFDRYFKAQHGRYCLKSLQNIVKTIREIQAEIAPGERFSICEIAQSRAYLAPSVIPELDFNQCDFTFLSPNESSVNHFNETHHHYPLATAKIISETGDNTQTEINHAGFQLAVITLDTHDIQSLVSSLKLLTQHLCENATILISGISSQSWHRLVFEPAQVNLNNNVCLSLLKQSGFTDIKTITSDIDIEDLFILSSKWSKRTLVDSGSQENCNNEDNGYCLFLGTAQPDEKLIKSSFDKYRASHTILSVDSLEKFKNTLHSLSNENGKITHIIYANGLGYSTEPFKQQSLRCSELSELHQLLDSSSQQPLVTILTRNVADMYRRSSIEPPIEQRLPADAALWGFGRTLMNEASSYSLRLIDLPEDLNLAVLNQLNEEIFHSTLESEIFIDTRGDRFAPRLRLEKHPFYKKALADNSRSQTSLQFDIPGQLKNLVWKSTDSPDLGPDQVEVEIKATGLNFRDVMYALGLLSDEAIENGFAGASLG
ncbi:MAG: polyketide synthase dehydratase domain-containing protein, partial [Gammaproteobacteria bacterium]|nr:polyketide synthase dehydratase domain-containing protein [Gammaproteobacteria bacterium]